MTQLPTNSPKTTKPINTITQENIDNFLSYPELFNYQEIATQTAIYPGQGTPLGLMYVALKLAGEAGEFAQCLGKAMRDDNCYSIGDVYFGQPAQLILNVKDFAPERLAKFKHELGGVLWYLAAACKELDINLQDVALENLLQLKSRSERGTLSGDGDDR